MHKLLLQLFLKPNQPNLIKFNLNFQSFDLKFSLNSQPESLVGVLRALNSEYNFKEHNGHNCRVSPLKKEYNLYLTAIN